MDAVLLFADTMQEIKDIPHTAKRFLEGELLLTLKEETVGKTKYNFSCAFETAFP